MEFNLFLSVETHQPSCADLLSLCQRWTASHKVQRSHDLATCDTHIYQKKVIKITPGFSPSS